MAQPTYLVYISFETAHQDGGGFQSRLVLGKDAALEALLHLIFGEAPDPVLDPDQFDELISIKNDFENAAFWREGGNIWETEFSGGYVAIVRVTDHLN